MRDGRGPKARLLLPSSVKHLATGRYRSRSRFGTESSNMSAQGHLDPAGILADQQRHQPLDDSRDLAATCAVIARVDPSSMARQWCGFG